MVLRVVIIFFLSSFFSDETKLLDKYSKTVEKELSKTFKEEIDLVNISFTTGELFTIVSHETNQTKGYFLLSEVAACKLGGCNAFVNANDGLNSEYFDVFVILDETLKIKKIKILDYFSDYGYEITSKRYLKRFKEMSVCKFSNEEDQIDAISGATISSYALEGILAQLCFLDSK